MLPSLGRDRSRAFFVALCLLSPHNATKFGRTRPMTTDRHGPTLGYMKRVVAAFLVGLLVGTGVWAAVNSVPWWDPWGFWGFFFGIPAALGTFGLVLMWLGRRQPNVRSF